MAPPLHLWLPALTVLALSACGGSEGGLFRDVPNAGAGGSNRAGASPSAGAGSVASSGAGSASAGSAGEDTAGSGSGGTAAAGSSGLNSGGTNSGGTSSGGTNSGGTNNAGGTAGRMGAGGRAGAGAGGRPGTGGGVGAAGHAGESGGVAGHAGGGSNSICNELLEQASTQLEAARVCYVAADAPQCTSKVTSPCGCQVPVRRSDSTETKAYLKTLKLLEDQDCAVACAAIACPSVSDARCKASDGGSKGVCMATNHGSTP